MNCFKWLKSWFKQDSSQETLKELEEVCTLQFARIQRLQNDLNDFNQRIVHVIKLHGIQNPLTRECMRDIQLKEREIKNAKNDYNGTRMQLENLRNYITQHETQMKLNKVIKKVGKQLKPIKDLESQIEQRQNIQDQMSDYNETVQDANLNYAGDVNIDDNEIDERLNQLSDQIFNNTMLETPVSLSTSIKIQSLKNIEKEQEEKSLNKTKMTILDKVTSPFKSKNSQEKELEEKEFLNNKNNLISSSGNNSQENSKITSFKHTNSPFSKKNQYKNNQTVYQITDA